MRFPIVVFLLLGMLFFLGYSYFYNYLNKDQNTIFISQAEIEMLNQDWQMKFNRPPTSFEKEAMIQQIIKEKVLYQTALEMGLDKEDRAIQRRMVQKVEYLGLELMQPQQPSESQLMKYFEEQKERYKSEEYLSLTHVFFDPDKREESTISDAEYALKELKQRNDPTEDVTRFGDSFMLDSFYPNKTEVEIRKLFGSGFTESVFELEPGIWHGPVLSGYGTHLVYIHGHEKSRIPDYTEARDYVLNDWLEEKKAELEKVYIDGLLARYNVIIENGGQ